MEMVAPGFAFDAEAPRIVRTAPEAALHFRADAHIFQLYLMGDGDAVGDELAVFVSIDCREIKIEDDAAAVRAQWQDQVRVHDTLVKVDHQIRKDPPVIGVAAGADLADRGIKGRLEGARL